MSYDRLPSLEAQPTTTRREDDITYRDDPEFQSLTQALSSQLFTLTSNVSKLSNQVALLGTKRDTERVRERVHDLLEETQSGFKRIGEGVKKAQAWDEVGPHQRYIQQKLFREFQSSLAEFQTVQRSAIDKQRSSARAARNATEEQQQQQQQQQAHSSSPSREQQIGGQLDQAQLRLAPQDEVDFQDSLIVERESEIRHIEQSVGELNELFRDVAHIVNEQGEQLDLIADNVENVRNDTHGADRELRSASKYQKSARNRACCLLFILAIILAVILLAIFV